MKEDKRKMQKPEKFACRCCGFLTLDEEPRNTFEICPVCFWEDDAVQIEEPALGGANYVTISEARENFARFGAVEERLLPFVRPPYPEEYPS